MPTAGSALARLAAPLLLPGRARAVAAARAAAAAEFGGRPAPLPLHGPAAALVSLRGAAASAGGACHRPAALATAAAVGGDAGGAGDAPAAAAPTLLLYSKADCPLCDTLKDKLDAVLARAAFAPGAALHGARVEVRDIFGNPAWEAAYAMEVPVLAIAAPGGGQLPIARPSPRATADQLERHLEKALERARQG
jgi:hypothetical protein